MPNFPLILDYANLFCGSAPDDETASNHLVLSELKLPTMEVQYLDHRPGGAPLAIEIDVLMTRLDVSFDIVGVTPQILILLDTLELQKTEFHAYGNLRNYLTGGATQLYARFTGQLGRVEPAPFRRGDVFHIKYQVRGLRHYELQIGGDQVYHWDFFTNYFYTPGEVSLAGGAPDAGPG